jgi:uncharacterized protein YndB with AHSA1/START domain
VSETFRTSIEIAAEPNRVFDHFVRPELLVRWMGEFARLDAREGGIFAVDVNGAIIRGSFVRVERPHLIEIAWGEAGNDGMPPGATRLIVRLTERRGGTLVELEHSGLSAVEHQRKRRGWPHLLERLRVLASGGDPGADGWAVNRHHDKYPV